MIGRSFDYPERDSSEITIFEHVRKYLEQVIAKIPYTYNPSLGNTDISLDAKKQHFISGMNYFVGLKLTIKQSQIKENKDKISQNVIPFIRSKIYTSPSKKYDTELKDDMTANYPSYYPVKAPIGNNGILHYQTKGSYRNKGGYVLYVRGNSDQAEGLHQTISFINSFEDNRIISITAESMFYNVNYGYIFYLSQSFLVNHGSKIDTTTNMEGLDPRLYSTKMKPGYIVAIMLALQIIFQVIVLYELIKLIIKTAYYISDLVAGNKIYIAMNDIISLVIIAFCIADIAFWYQQYFQLK